MDCVLNSLVSQHSTNRYQPTAVPVDVGQLFLISLTPFIVISEWQGALVVMTEHSVSVCCPIFREITCCLDWRQSEATSYIYKGDPAKHNVS